MNTQRRRTHALILILGATLALAPAATAAAAPTAPVVHTGGASSLTFQSATLSGTVNPGAQPTTYFFQYGTTTTYGGQSLPAGLAAGTTAVAVQSAIAGLAPKTKYHYRIVAVNNTATRLGADATFTTAAIPLSLAIVGVPNPVQFGSPVTVAGTLSGTGAGGRQVVLQQNPYPFTAGFQNVGNIVLSTPAGSFAFNLLSLPLTTQFRVVSIGAGAPVISPILTEYVGLGVTLRVTRHRIRHGYFSVRFAGVVSPAEDGARVSLQRLVGSSWRFVRGTSAKPSSAGTSTYALTLRLRHGGYYRTNVTPVEGGHVASISRPMLVHVF
ncbi:MAG: hypothetical protein LC720_01765 [Actinobacteria bacterium]|nr:hypothetical protein [Actinomycetota bacterium]